MKPDEHKQDAWGFFEESYADAAEAIQEYVETEKGAREEALQTALHRRRFAEDLFVTHQVLGDISENYAAPTALVADIVDAYAEQDTDVDLFCADHEAGDAVTRILRLDRYEGNDIHPNKHGLLTVTYTGT